MVHFIISDLYLSIYMLINESNFVFLSLSQYLYTYRIAHLSWYHPENNYVTFLPVVLYWKLSFFVSILNQERHIVFIYLFLSKQPCIVFTLYYICYLLISSRGVFDFITFGNIVFVMHIRELRDNEINLQLYYG